MSIYEPAGDAIASRPLPPAAALPAFPNRARVLIVDDIAENRVLLGLCCDQFGLRHESVDSGRLAVEAAQSGRFDAILMDIFMPGMDGIGATRAILALDGPLCAPPIIAVTTAAEPGDVQRYLACGMADVVPKPVNVARLANALSDAFAMAKRDRRSRKRKTAEQDAERMTA